MQMEPSVAQEDWHGEWNGYGADLGGCVRHFPRSSSLANVASALLPQLRGVLFLAGASRQRRQLGDEERYGYEGTIFADTGEHGGYDPVLWLARDDGGGFDSVASAEDDDPPAPASTTRSAMEVDGQAPRMEVAEQRDQEGNAEPLRSKEENASSRLETAAPHLDTPPPPPAASSKQPDAVDLDDPSSDESSDDDPLAERRLRAKVVLYNKALELHYDDLLREPGGADKVAEEKNAAKEGWEEGYAAMAAAWRRHRHRLRREAHELGARELGISMTPSSAAGATEEVAGARDEREVPDPMEVDAAEGDVRPSPLATHTRAVSKEPHPSSAQAPSPLLPPSHPPPPPVTSAKPPAASEPLAEISPALPPPPRPHSALPAVASNTHAPHRNAKPLAAFEPPPHPLPPQRAAVDVEVKQEEREGADDAAVLRHALLTTTTAGGRRHPLAATNAPAARAAEEKAQEEHACCA